MPVHRTLTPDENHPIHSYYWANTAARLAQVVTAADLGRVGIQDDDGSIWTLIDDNPVEWAPLTPNQPALITGFYPGQPKASALMLAFLPTVPMTLPANLAGSRVKVGSIPAATAVLSIQKNGVEVGTISITNVGGITFTMASAVTLSTSDELTVVAPGVADTTLADVRFTLHGSR